MFLLRDIISTEGFFLKLWPEIISGCIVLSKRKIREKRQSETTIVRTSVGQFSLSDKI